MSPEHVGPQPVVIDTNIVLDLLLFRDPSTAALARALAGESLIWHATTAMRDELQRGLTYPALQPWLARTDRDDAAGILAQFDRLSQVHADVPTGLPRCSDPDDQKFIDLALALQALLLSKDHAVLRLRRALAGRDVTVARGFSFAA